MRDKQARGYYVTDSVNSTIRDVRAITMCQSLLVSKSITEKKVSENIIISSKIHYGSKVVTGNQHGWGTTPSAVIECIMNLIKQVYMAYPTTTHTYMHAWILPCKHSYTGECLLR